MHVPLAERHYMSRCSLLLDVVKHCAYAFFLFLHTHTHTHTLFVADHTELSSACCLCVPESAARRVMEHALLNDESEYFRERDRRECIITMEQAYHV